MTRNFIGIFLALGMYNNLNFTFFFDQKTEKGIKWIFAADFRNFRNCFAFCIFVCLCHNRCQHNTIPAACHPIETLPAGNARFQFFYYSISIFLHLQAFNHLFHAAFKSPWRQQCAQRCHTSCIRIAVKRYL